VTLAHVPEVPTNVVARASGPTSITVTWDAPWYAGSSPVVGYDLVVTDSSGASTLHRVEGDATSARVTHLEPEDTYRFQVAARNATGSSPLSDGSAPQVMRFSLAHAAVGEASKAKGLWSSLRRNALTKSVPTGRAAASLRSEYRDATQQPDDRYEALRSFRRDEGTTWVPPTSQ